MCFYAYILARETKLIIRWADITELSKTNSILFPDSIRVVTRDNKEVNNMLQYSLLIIQNCYVTGIVSFFLALFFNVSS